MPSPDDTYYNIKRLHVVFAVSSLALLAVTVWMLAADHWRQWKVYQRTFRDDIQPWLTEARIRETQTEEFTARENELKESLEEARTALPDPGLIRKFSEELKRGALERGADPPEVDGIEAAYESLVAQPGVQARENLLALLSEHLTAAKNRQASVDRELQFRRAEFAEARSFYEAGVGEGFSQTQLDELQARVHRAHEKVEQLVARSEEASARAETLAGLLHQMTRQEDAARQALADHRASVARLERAWAEQRPNLGKRLLRLPLIDALGRPLAVHQIWLPELTIDYNFRQVARFDRCVTCHQGIDKTVPGSPSEPACLGQQVLAVYLPVPDGLPQPNGGESGGHEDEQSGAVGSTLRNVFGLALASRGILEPDVPTVGLVLTRTPAADAELLAGDVILKIDDTEVHSPHEASRSLLEAVRKPEASQADGPSEADQRRRAVKLGIRRGLPHPYGSHPRLDLFVGSLSPHPVSEFGCTICHDGQGSATEFKFASHTPNDPDQRIRWREEYGWFWNEHWDFRMRPARFAQSGCLKCHHEVTDLAPGGRFPEPPAPKLLAGYQLVRRNGCFGCHEIRGVTVSRERVGPDMRLEPSYHEAALQLLADPNLADPQRSLARQVVEQPENGELRRQLAASLAVDPAGVEAPGTDRRAAASAAALNVLAAEDPMPGTMRKVGPSMRDMAGKLDGVFLDDWLRDSAQFRPDTRMPQFYGLHEHLDGKGLEDAERFEAVEIRAVTDYLLALSQPVEPLPAPPEVTEPPSRERGKRLFLTRGCLACHRHDDFPEAQSTFALDLSRLGAKLGSEAGRKWLVSWIRDPARHSPRTFMPNLLLEPIPLAEAGGDGDADGGDADAGGVQAEEANAPQPPVTDPAADIAAYLLGSPAPDEKPRKRQPLVEADLDELVLSHLSTSLSRRRAEECLKGTFELTAEQALGDTVELLGPVTREKKIRYVGRRTIRKRGCYGCHDIPGFEDAQPIGPALSDWGRKQESLLAFEQIHRLVAKEPLENDGKSGPALGPKADADPDRPFYVEALLAHRREGFIWQKLRAPRSFDYKKTENKGYNERLTMGRFSFRPEEREAIITFVLGLVAEPPAEKYVYQGDRRRRAIAEGRKVLDRYGCAECHTLEMERWKIQYDPEEVEEPYETEDFAFLKPRIDTRQLDAQAKPDRRGLLHAEAVGTPQTDEAGEIVEDFDDDDHPMYYFNLWEPLAIKAQEDWGVWTVGGAEIGISDPKQIVTRPPGENGSPQAAAAQPTVRPTYTPHLTAVRPAVGGAFARLLFPHVLSDQSPAVTEAWGWVPPPLVGEGFKVQPAWLHDYLLEPFPIRPASVLRMPKHNLSPAEAGRLVDYFAALAGVDFPYSSDPRSRSTGLEAKEFARPNRLDDAMRIVTDRTTFCAKCHLIGDFGPGGEVQTVLAPRLDRVSRRLRPEHLRRWVANPKTRLPYTAMPVNFPPTGPPLGQNLFQGGSAEQLDAVTDLLLNYDWYLRRRTSIRAMIHSSDQGESGAASDGD